MGLTATGGGILAAPPPEAGRELSGAVVAFEDAVDFFHGVADPLDGAIPGNTDTGLADASADREVTLGAEFEDAGFEALGGGRRPAGGGGGAAALGLGGTSSR